MLSFYLNKAKMRKTFQCFMIALLTSRKVVVAFSSWPKTKKNLMDNLKV